METYLEILKKIEARAKVDEWPEWKKSSVRSMRFGESFEREEVIQMVETKQAGSKGTQETTK